MAAPALWTLAGLASARQVTPHALADFFGREVYAGAALSPSGASVAMVRQEMEEGRRRAYVEVADGANPSGPRRRVPIGDYDIEAIEWVSE